MPQRNVGVKSIKNAKIMRFKAFMELYFVKRLKKIKKQPTAY
jgi:hypothetical protein